MIRAWWPLLVLSAFAFSTAVYGWRVGVDGDVLAGDGIVSLVALGLVLRSQRRVTR